MKHGVSGSRPQREALAHNQAQTVKALGLDMPPTLRARSNEGSNEGNLAAGMGLLVAPSG